MSYGKGPMGKAANWTVNNLVVNNDALIKGDLVVQGDVSFETDSEFLGDLIMGDLSNAGGDIINYIDGSGGIGLQYTGATGALELATNLTVGGDLDVAYEIQHTGDINTKIRFTPSEITIFTANFQQLLLSGGSPHHFTVNPTNQDIDFIVNNDTDTTLTIDGSTSPFILVDTDKQLRFRDAAIYIASLNDGYLDLEADTAVRVNANLDVIQNIRHTGDTDTYIAFTTDQIVLSAGGSASFTHATNLTTVGHAMIMSTNAELRFRDSTIHIHSSADTVLDITADGTINLNAPVTKLSTDTQLRFRDSTISINSSTDGQMDINSDTAIVLTTGTFIMQGVVRVTEYLTHQGDTDTGLRYQDNQITLSAGGVDGFDLTPTLATWTTVDQLFNGLYQRDTSESVADDGTIVYTTTVSGWGFVQAGDNEEYAIFSFSSDGTVILIQNSANVDNADTDGNLCIYDGGSGIIIKNRLGDTKTIRYSIRDSA